MNYYLSRAKTNKVFSLKKLILVSVFFFILFAVSPCSQFLSTGHVASSDHALECNVVHFVNSSSTRDIFMLVSLVLSLAILFSVRATTLISASLDVIQYIYRHLLSRALIVHKLFNSILHAFRKGILHTQIYNTTF